MVFLNPMVSSSGVGRLVSGKLPVSTLLLCTQKIANADIGQQNVLCLLKVAVFCFVRKRSLVCSSSKTTSGAKKTNSESAETYSDLFSSIVNKEQSKRMCPLKSLDPDSLFEKYRSYYTSGFKNYYKDAVFVLGPMGSGKTTVIREKILTHKIYGNYAYVDTDEIMEQLPGFDKLHVDHFYPPARQIAIKLTDWLLDNQLSFVAEGTCVKYQELLDYMVRLKRKGYSIKVCKLLKVELDLVLKRSASRETRKIDTETVKDIYVQSKLGLQNLYDINKESTIFEDIDAENL